MSVVTNTKWVKMNFWMLSDYSEIELEIKIAKKKQIIQIHGDWTIHSPMVVHFFPDRHITFSCLIQSFSWYYLPREVLSNIWKFSFPHPTTNSTHPFVVFLHSKWGISDYVTYLLYDWNIAQHICMFEPLIFYIICSWGRSVWLHCLHRHDLSC